MKGIWELERNAENMNHRWVFSTFLKCSQMSQGSLSQCKTRLRLLHLLYDVEVVWQKTIKHPFSIIYTLTKQEFLTWSECTVDPNYIIIIIENLVHFGGPEWQACSVTVEQFESQCMPTEMNLMHCLKRGGLGLCLLTLSVTLSDWSNFGFINFIYQLIIISYDLQTTIRKKLVVWSPKVLVQNVLNNNKLALCST